ncbi:TetR/AcrR family transcriptional regulator [Acinetobacter indicus]|uniref:TetR/AcrR family transcriptional regulator n=1 Tax=Acinetobacter indicus TaxID=756892 RepID=UPI0014402E53|nr:TetR/AcrR family transcriptional regulator [Acinetobacter indicus]MDM1291555.1 TetR/AcrR family transcriptional regulator [Acinetobacter indicus]MDM1321525.1 TetR/AcrR family transcriptional regulator [Acinetobacter indicus]MDM1333192.1 TetR/AcrR family transcriptional regulator [Acinetobacter indicus]QIZ59056.1 TetR/AcrR family transcriptional regulator [Acinetobacter indicus]
MNVGRPKDLEKRQRILESAKSLFLKQGYHGSSMNEIARDAGVTKLTVYNHFQDKATLFTCAIEDTCEALIMARPPQLSTDSNFQQALAQLCALSLEIVYLPEAIKLEYLLLDLASQQSPLLQQFYQASHQKLNQVWQHFFQQAIDLGFIQQMPLEQLIQLMLSLLLGQRHHEILLGIRPIPATEEQQQLIQSSIQLFLQAISE